MEGRRRFSGGSAPGERVALDLLELHLDLMRMDLEDEIAMKKVRFDGVRWTANEVVATAPLSTTIKILDSVTMEAQRIARVANLLGFADSGLEEDVKVNEDDLDWCFSEDMGAGGEGKNSGLQTNDENDLKLDEDLDLSSANIGRSPSAQKAEITKSLLGSSSFSAQKAEVTKSLLLGKIARLSDLLRVNKRGPFILIP